MVRQETRVSEVILALFVIAITALLLIPLPTLLLDLLLSVNLCLSMLLLLVGLYTPNALSLLSFPSLLLLTTLFRLGLNVASARLILSQAYAGKVIETFGTFLIRGEVVVGVIIFVIITIVNFIVISRGASRVSEVAARFALDAMPGKQMAIDADMRAGSISREEAERRRDDLRKESQLYGSMDGAMKFVQGDAIAGFFIILTNIVGGLYVGISNGLDFGDAIHTYTVLTVGDGLVSQIPALLISICAGIVVTRVSSSESSTLGADLGMQLFRKPSAVIFAGLLLFSLGLVPGLPHLSFLAIGGLFVVSGLLLRRGMRAGTISGYTSIIQVPGTESGRFLGGRAAQLEYLMPDHPYALEIKLDEQVLYKSFLAEQERMRSFLIELKRDVFMETGLTIPIPSVVPARELPPGGYSLEVNAVEIESGRLPLDALLIEMSPELAHLSGLEILAEEPHPITGAQAFWTPARQSNRKVCEAGEYGALHYLQFLALKLCAFVRDNPEEVLSLGDVHAMLKSIDASSPGVLQELNNAGFVGAPRLTKILCTLVRDGVSIKDFRQIVEAVVSYGSGKGNSAEEATEVNLPEAVAYVRQTRKRQVLSRLLTDRRSLRVITLSRELETTFEGLEESDDLLGILPMAPETYERLKGSFGALIEPVLWRGTLPLSVLCRAEIRARVAKFLRSFSKVAVISYEELDPAFPIELVGSW